MRKKHRSTLLAIFEDPVRANILWTDIEALFVSLGAVVEERKGSRLAVYLNGGVAIFHRPHPDPNTDKGAVKSVRKFLLAVGVSPEMIDEE
jgi:hypothetical protein